MTTTTQPGVEPSVNATSGASEIDAITNRVAAIFKEDKARSEGSNLTADEPADEPADEETELSTETKVSVPEDAAESDDQEGEEPAGEDAEAAAEGSEDDSDSEEQSKQLSSIQDLADALEIPVEQLMDLELPTKVDGEEGKTTLRGLLKSFQTEQHLTRKGQKLADEARAVDLKRQEVEKATQERLQALDVSLQLANQRLLGKFSRLDWESLRTQNPQAYQQAYIEYQQLYGELSQAANALRQEQARAHQERQAQYEEFVKQERQRWLEKMPAWADPKVKDTDLKDLKEYVKGLGIDPADLDRVADHRYGLIMKDALEWHRLQSRAKQVKKAVKSAGPIVKPGIRKSSAAVNADALSKAKERIRKSGSTDDLAAFIKGSGLLR